MFHLVCKKSIQTNLMNIVNPALTKTNRVMLNFLLHENLSLKN